MTQFPETYITAKELAIANPTLENWRQFEAQFYALPRLITPQELPDDAVAEAIRERVNDFTAVARHVASHLPIEDIQANVALTLAYCEMQQSENS